MTTDDWVSFETMPSFKNSTLDMMRRDDRPRRRTKKRDSPNLRATWMEKPIASDASWLPLPPPRHQQEASEARDDWDSPRLNRAQATLPPMTPRRRERASSTGGDVNQSHTSSHASSSRPHENPSPRAKGYGRSIFRDDSGNEVRDQPPSGRLTRERSLSRNGVDSSSGRRRSSSKAEPTHRARSTSRTRVESPSPSNRARLTSRTRIDSPSRTRSRGTRPLPSPVAQPRSRGRSPSKPHSESRSRSLSRSRQATGPSPTQTKPRQTSSTGSLGRGFPPRQAESLPVSFERIGGPGAKIYQNVSGELVRISQASKSVNSSRKEGGIMERLFGDHVSEEAKHRHCSPSVASIGSLGTAQHPGSIHPKVLLCATVYKNAATGLWIATINTNQKGVATNPKTASKYLKAFSFSSEREAREAAIANAPPKMMPFDESLSCFVCKGKFALFRRACHCRNCGACVCSSCTTTWSSKMLPETYNLKNESVVKICKSCCYLTDSFRKSLLKGDLEEALNLYATGNINLRCPLPASSGTKKIEIMYPVHCAVYGGNLGIVRWLMDEHFCPITSVRKTSNGKARKSLNADGGASILTSKGRSVLNIAMQGLKVDIVRYLVVEKGVSVYEVKDLQMSLRLLEAVLLAFPQNRDVSTTLDYGEIAVPRWDNANFSDGDASYVCSSLGEDQSTLGGEFSFSEHNQAADVDMCIICYANKIDCVITPCGHQICCLDCSSNLKICPVCNVECAFIRIFRP